MTNEKMLEMVCKAEKELNEKCIYCSWIVEMKEALTDDIRAEEAKKCGCGNAQKIAEKVIKRWTTLRTSAIYPNSVYGAWLNNDGKQIITDGFLVARLGKMLPVTEATEDATFPTIDGLINAAQRKNTLPLPLPTISELKAHIKTQKAEHKGEKGYKPLWDFGRNLPQVDAEYLADAIELLGGIDVVAVCDEHCKNGAIYFSAWAGDGVLMPVRKV